MREGEALKVSGGAEKEEPLMFPCGEAWVSVPSLNESPEHAAECCAVDGFTVELEKKDAPGLRVFQKIKRVLAGWERG